MRITIVTPTLNRRAMLAEALASVAAQHHDDVDHIVVDGGSTDGTLEMLAEHPDVRVLQDRRLGLYDAINQGIEAASGTIIGLLNSDDLYAPGIFAAAKAAFAAHPDVDAVCGTAELFDETGTIRRYDDIADLRLDSHAALIGSCIPNARFFRRRVFDEAGTFPTDYRYVADRAFLVRTLIAGIRTQPLPVVAYRYRQHGGSLTFAAQADKADVLRTELLRLARAIAAEPLAPRPLQAKARALEGRCLAQLAVNRLRAGDVMGAARLALPGGGQRPLSAFRAILAGLRDRRRPSRDGA